MTMEFNEIKFGKDGLLPIIVQEEKTGEVLMLAYTNEETLRKSLSTGESYFWSRSRKKIWKKGEVSGNIQKLREVLLDCDGDTILFKVEQKGGACHKGYKSCFFRILNKNGEWKICLKKVFDEKKAYNKKLKVQS